MHHSSRACTVWDNHFSVSAPGVAVLVVLGVLLAGASHVPKQRCGSAETRPPWDRGGEHRRDRNPSASSAHDRLRSSRLPGFPDESSIIADRSIV
jgi:hypothetical protein